MKKVNLKKIALAAIFCALAFVSMFVFRIKVQFLTFDTKDAIIGISSLLLGPLYGVCSAAVVALLELISVSDTGVYGLIMNFLSTGTFALTCGAIYKYRRTLSGAITAMSLSVVSVTSVMLLANIFVTPVFMGVPRSMVIDLLPTLFLPFNLAKSALNAAVALVIYKPLSSALKRAKLLPDTDGRKYRFTMRSAIITVCAAVVIVLAALVLFLYLNGSFEIIRSK